MSSTSPKVLALCLTLFFFISASSALERSIERKSLNRNLLDYSIDRKLLESNVNRHFRTASYLPRRDHGRSFGSGRTHTTNFGQLSKISGVNVREKDIAAIFRRVAYGDSHPETTTLIPSTTSTPPPTTVKATTTTTPSFVKYKTTPRVSSLENSPEESVGTLRILKPITENKEVSQDADSRSGILNYFVEERENKDIFESSHSGRREFYPEVISSVEPKKVGSNAKKYVVSNNGDQQSITVHVYIIGTLMALVALASLCCLCRIHSCTQLIPRGHYVTLQLLILLAAALRCIVLLHDPYGLEGKLPRALMSLLMNTVQPLLSTVLAVMLLVLLRAAKFYILPASLQSPLVLAVITGLHIGVSVLVDISNGVLDYPESAGNLEAGVQCVTVGWETILLVGYIIILYQVFTKSSTRNVILPLHTCAVVTISLVLKAILIGFVFYNILTVGFSSSDTNETKTWSWWLFMSCERLLEIFFLISMVTATATLTMKRSNMNSNDQKIFSVISGFDQPMKCNTMGGKGSTSGKSFISSNYTLASTLQNNKTMNLNFAKNFSPTNSKTYDSSTDFQVQWKSKTNSRSQECLDVENHYIAKPSEPSNQNGLNSYNNCQTLPSPRYYCAPVPVISHASPVIGHVAPCTLRPSRTSQHHIYSEIDDVQHYDLASYYTESIPSSSGEIYSSPHLPISKTFVPTTTHVSISDYNSPDQLYEIARVHQKPNYNNQRFIETRNQCAPSRSSASTTHQNYNNPHGNLAFSMPFNSTNQSNNRSNGQQRSNNIDASPDSAIVLDYSSHSELDEYNHHHYQQNRFQTLKNIQEQQYSSNGVNSNNKLDFMKLSTHSLNDVFKYNSGLLSKLVGSGSPKNTGYQPLNLEDTTNHSRENSQLTEISSMPSPQQVKDYSHNRAPHDNSQKSHHMTGSHEAHGSPVSPLLQSPHMPVTSL